MKRPIFKSLQQFYKTIFMFPLHELVLSCVQLFVTPGTVACQGPLFMGFFSGKSTGAGIVFFSRASSQSRD